LYAYRLSEGVETMPEEARTNEPTSEDFGVSVDPATWVDPKETFPGIIEVSRKRWASDEYKKETEFRPAITDPLPQWDIRVRRLDAELVLPDGSKVPAIRYGGIDLKKYSAREQALVPISSRFPKEYWIANEWKRVFGKIEPTETLEGKYAMFDFYPSKSFGGSMPARNVLVPVSVLPPDYQYTGEVRLITVRERAETEGATEATTPSATEPELSADEAQTALLPYLVGKNRNDPASIITSLPPELRLAGILTSLATGDLIKDLQAAGTIEVATDGTISLTVVGEA